MGQYHRDPSHWLLRMSPDEWIRAALGELERAEKAWDRGDVRAGAVGVKRAAGMALNGALIVERKDNWGRTYVEHLAALAVDAHVPEAVRTASRIVLEAQAPSGPVVSLRTPRTHVSLMEAARDVIAHAWVVVKRHDSPDI